MIEALLVISALVNVLFIVYARWLIRIIKVGEEDIRSVGELIGQYVAHVNSVHQLEMFYGDPTLESLIRHGREIVEQLDQLDYIVLELEDPESEQPPRLDPAGEE